MKTMVFLGCVWMTLGAPLMAEPSQVMHFLAVTDQVLDDFSKGKTGDLVLEIPEGVSIPLGIALKGDVLALNLKQIPELRVLRTCYIRCPEKGSFLFSKDLHEWASFFEFFSGHLNMGVRVNEGAPIVAVDLDLTQRNI